MRALLLAATLLAASPAAAQEPLQARVEKLLAEQAGPGTRFGLVVTDDAGREIVAIAPDQRFVPASNTKLFSTAAAFAVLPDVAQPDALGGASVRFDGPDVVLTGRGDARLSSAADCVADCLSILADAIAATRRPVRDVVGDDSFFPDERWSLGMSWNNIETRSGTAISALTLDDNEVLLTVAPGRAGSVPAARGGDYYTIDNRAITVAAGGRTALTTSRAPNSRMLRLDGSIAADAGPQLLRQSVDDPADYAATRLRALLLARGVRVTGAVRVRHRLPGPQDDPALRKGTPYFRAPEPAPLARLTPPPLLADLTLTNKVSQNLHADLLLRRAGAATGSGSVADGHAVVRDLLAKAGVEPWRVDLADGSGMSTYNRVSPRGMARFLNWSRGQGWGAAFRATFPVGGIDGTLARRFKGTPLEGKVFAKTGTIDKAAALSGFLTTASGKTLTFATFAADMPAGGPSASAAVDAALNLIAAEN